ncbi:hypothetical protein J3S22_06340 [Corynebacterium aurimucosum]|uniref:hypothetical protein n=1 Tax=Corynebacterium aurimucosum TaxID=169292 RepID=UPI00209C6EE0|nr:hypothetical protein [Corynebacterium aurimucosum]UTA70429.1 hypothetical protein J3S22_06340 [Corynebacterium aurimucosum]
MPWFKVDDGFYDHPKVENLPMAARGLWLTCGVWCAKHLTDGVISAKRVRALGGTPAQIKALIKNGLWVEGKDDSGAKCYAFHDWFDMQPSREQIYEKREIERQKKRKQRTNQTDEIATTSRFAKMSPGDRGGDNPGDNPGDSPGLSPGDILANLLVGGVFQVQADSDGGDLFIEANRAFTDSDSKYRWGIIVTPTPIP